MGFAPRGQAKTFQKEGAEESDPVCKHNAGLRRRALCFFEKQVDIIFQELSSKTAHETPPSKTAGQVSNSTRLIHLYFRVLLVETSGLTLNAVDFTSVDLLLVPVAKEKRCWSR